MDNQDLRTLKILEEIEDNQSPSQRYLSDQLNISLGLVNSFLKRLAKKGYFKATAIPKNRVKYIITPKGALEKSRLTYAYVQHAFKFYREARKKLKETLTRLDRGGTKTIAFYGAGDLAEIAYLSLQETNIDLRIIVDEERVANPFFRMKIEPPEALETMTVDKVLITKIETSDKVRKKLSDLGVRQEDIVTYQEL